MGVGTSDYLKKENRGDKNMEYQIDGKISGVAESRVNPKTAVAYERGVKHLANSVYSQHNVDNERCV